VGCYLIAFGAAQAVEFNKAAAWAILVKQCSYGPRMPGTKAHDECRDYLLAELKKYTDGAKLQNFDHTWRYKGGPYKGGELLHFSNVIGFQNWEKAKVHVVLTAHWDSRPFSDQDPDHANFFKPIMGADDGASGVAVLIELAKELQTNLNPDVGIEYVLNDGEDLGLDINEMLLGIDYYADRLPTPKPDYGILLDMIGNKGVRVPVEPTGLERAPQMQPLVREFYALANKIGLGSTFPEEEGPGVDDDHYPLIAKGVPTMDLIDFTFPYWHTQGDTVDKCDADALGAIGTALKAWFTQPKAFSLKRG
jgi:Zn-dependent M28 family amino/carboxypeptidase